MAGQTYTTQAGRAEVYKGRILAKAQVREMLTKVGAMDEMPQNQSEKIEWMRFLPFGGVDNQWIAAGGDQEFVQQHIVQEGVTPTADNITWTLVSTVLQEIGCLYSYTNKTRYLHEEGSEIPKEMEDQAATRIVLTREMMTYGESKAATNVFFGGDSANSINTVAGPPTKGLFQRISRAILGAHGTTVHRMLKSGVSMGMQSVNASWPVYCHTDMEKTFENMVGFTKRQDYGVAEYLDPDYEIGAIGRFRIIINPILTYLPGAGAAVGLWEGTGLPKSDSPGNNIDVYPLVTYGAGLGGGESIGQVALRGYNAIQADHFPPSERSKIDPLGQRGYVAACTWQAQKILNDGWMALAYVGTED